MCGALATRLASRIEDRAGEVEPLLDVDRARGLAQHRAHLLGDVHEQRVEHLEPHRVRRASRPPRPLARRARDRVASCSSAAVRDGPAPARRDPAGRAVFAEQQRDPAAPQPGCERRPRAARARRATHRRSRRERAAAAPGWQAGSRHRVACVGSPVSGRSTASAITVASDERACARRRTRRAAGARRRMPRRNAAAGCHGSSIGGVGSRQSHVRACAGFRCAAGRPPGAAVPARASSSSAASRLAAAAAPVASSGRSTVRRRDGATAGEPDAVGRQDARERMQQHLVDAEQVGDGAGMLARRAAEAQQREPRGILAVVQREFADGVRHACDGDLEERLGQRLARVIATGVARSRCAASSARRAREAATSIGWSPVGPKTRGKSLGRNPTQHDVAVRDRRGTIAAIAGRAWIGAGGRRAHLQPTVGEPQDRAAACGDRLQVDERDLQADAVDLGRESPWHRCRPPRGSRPSTCRPCRNR